MVFNDTVTNLGLCQEVDDTCGTNTTSYPLASKARRANSAMSDYASIALTSDTRWQWGDTNSTDLPIGDTDMESGVSDYTMTVDMLKVLRVECLTEAGTTKTLIPIDRRDSQTPLSEQFATDGEPVYYDIHENVISIYPAPSYNSTDGLTVYYQKDAEYFTASDTTKKPGIPQVHHKYIALKMVEPYARDKQLKNYVSIRNEIQKYEEEIIPEFYAKRNKDEVPALKGRIIDCK